MNIQRPVKLFGKPLNPTDTPTDNQVPTFNDATGQFDADDGGGGGGAFPYTVIESTADLFFDPANVPPDPVTTIPQVIPGLTFTPDANSMYEGKLIVLCTPSSSGSGRSDFNVPSLASGSKSNIGAGGVAIITESSTLGMFAGEVNRMTFSFAFTTGASVSSDVEAKFAQLSATGTLRVHTGCQLWYRKVA